MKASVVLFLTLGLTSLAPQSGACWWPNRVLKRYFGSDDDTTPPPTTLAPDPARDTTIFVAPTAPEQYVTGPLKDSGNAEPSDGVALTTVPANHPEATAYPIAVDPDGSYITTMLTEAVRMSTAATESPTMPTEASTLSPIVPNSTAPPDFDSSSDDASESASYDHNSTDVAVLASDSTSTMTPNEVTDATSTLFTLASDNLAASAFDSGHADSAFQPTVHSDVVANTTTFTNFSSVVTTQNEDFNDAPTQFVPESPESTVSTDYNWNPAIGTQSSVPSPNTAFVPEPTTSTMAKNMGATSSVPLSASNISVVEPTADVTTVAVPEEAAASPGTVAHVTDKQEATPLAQPILMTLAVTRPQDDNVLDFTTGVLSVTESTASQTSEVTMSSQHSSVMGDIGVVAPSIPIFQPVESETLPARTQSPAGGASMQPNSSTLMEDGINHNDSFTLQQSVTTSTFPSRTVTPELTRQTVLYPQTTSTAAETTVSRKYEPVYVRRFTPWLISRTSSTASETSTLITNEDTPTSATVTAGHMQTDLNSSQPEFSPTLQPAFVPTTTVVQRSSSKGLSDVQTEKHSPAEPSEGPLTDTLVVPESFFGTRTSFNQFGRPYCPGCDARLIKLPARFSLPWLRPYLYS